MRTLRDASFPSRFTTTIAVNDGSPDEESNRVFEEQAERAKARGWDFYRQENAFVDAARNSAARRGSGEFLLFFGCGRGARAQWHRPHARGNRDIWR